MRDIAGPLVLGGAGPSALYQKDARRPSPDGAPAAPLGPLAREVALERGAEDLLLFRERRPYLAGIQDARAGAEAARVVLGGR